MKDQNEHYQLMFPDQKVKTKNVSSNGVYFEVKTDDVKKYSLGKMIKIEIEEINSESMIPAKTVWIYGIGVIVRVDEIDATNHYKKLGVVMKFNEGLKVYV